MLDVTHKEQQAPKDERGDENFEQRHVKNVEQMVSVSLPAARNVKIILSAFDAKPVVLNYESVTTTHRKHSRRRLIDLGREERL